MDMNALNAAYETLSRQTMQLTKNTTTALEGTIDVTEAGYFVLSIAKENGWTLYVDGEKREAETFAGAFIATYLEEGTHAICLSYETLGLAMGAVVSGICVLAFCVTAILKWKIELRKKTDALTQNSASDTM